MTVLTRRLGILFAENEATVGIFLDITTFMARPQRRVEFLSFFFFLSFVESPERTNGTRENFSPLLDVFHVSFFSQALGVSRQSIFSDLAVHSTFWRTFGSFSNLRSNDKSPPRAEISSKVCEFQKFLPLASASIFHLLCTRI